MRPHLLLTALLTLATASAAQAQVLPGIKARDKGSIRAEFLNAVMEGVRVTSNAWTEALNRDDAAAAAGWYTEEALLVSADGRELNGRDEILAYLAETLGTQGRLETFLADVDASNNMAMTSERFTFAPGGAGGTEVRGLLLTVYVNEDRTWRIRAQFFRPGVSGSG